MSTLTVLISVETRYVLISHKNTAAGTRVVVDSDLASPRLVGDDVGDDVPASLELEQRSIEVQLTVNTNGPGPIVSEYEIIVYDMTIQQ